jgi:hypothetical protein
VGDWVNTDLAERDSCAENTRSGGDLVYIEAARELVGRGGGQLEGCLQYYYNGGLQDGTSMPHKQRDHAIVGRRAA